MKLNEILHNALFTDSDEQKALYEFYSKLLQDILDAKSMIEQKEKEVRIKISQYSQEVINYPIVGTITDVIPSVEGEFPYTGSWAERIDYVLEGKELTAREISNAIELYQPELKSKANSSVYPTLTDNVKIGKRYIKRYDAKTKMNKFSMK